MDLFKRIQDLSALYDDDGPSAMVPESRPMFNAGGQALKLKKLKEDIAKYTKEALDEGAKAVLEAGSKSLDMKQTIRDLIEEGADTYAELPTALKTKVKNQIDKYGEVTDEASARLLGRDKKTKTDREKLPDRGAKVVKGSYTRDYTNGELKVLAEKGLYDPNARSTQLLTQLMEPYEVEEVIAELRGKGFDSDGFKKGVPKKRTVTDRIVDIQFSDPKIKEEFIEDFKKRFKGTRMTAGKRGVDNKNLYTKYLSNLKPKTAELALAGLQASLSDQYGDEYRYKADKASLAKETKTSDAYLERISNDPQNLKVKARNIANLSTPERKGLGVLHHMYPKRIGDALNKLSIDTKNITQFSDAESVLQNLDFEKQKLMKDPIKNKRRIDEIQAIENRIVKGKNVPEVTTTSRRVNQYEPKPQTKYNVKFDRPGQKGLYGYQKIDTDNFSSRLKGADTSKSVAGLSDEVISKIDFKNVDVKNAPKIVDKIASRLVALGGKGCNVKRKAAFAGGRIKFNLGGSVSCIAKGLERLKNPTNLSPGEQANLKKLKELSQGSKGAKSMGTAMRFFAKAGIGSELALGGLFALTDYAGGSNKQEIISNFTYGLAGKSQKEQLKDKDAMYGLDRDILQAYSSLNEMDKRQNNIGRMSVKPGIEKKQIEVIKDIQQPFMSGPRNEEFDFEKFLERQRQTEQADLDYQKEKEKRSLNRKTDAFTAYDNDFMAAGGGIAKMAGDRSGSPPESGPNPQGLQGLMKRVKNI